jgi:uncharacterized protein (DUF4415 family)
MAENNGDKAPFAAYDALRDEDIDTSDLPELEDGAKGQRGQLYRPVKMPVTIRLDVDIVMFLKNEFKSEGYQAAINRVLREVMAVHRRNKATHPAAEFTDELQQRSEGTGPARSGLADQDPG